MDPSTALDSRDLLRSAMLEGLVVLDCQSDAQGRLVEGVVTQLNPAAERILGVVGSEVLGQPASSLFGVREHDFYQRALKADQPLRREAFYPKAGKHLRLTLVAVGLGRLALLIEDLTEFRTSEQALRAAEERLRLALTHLPDHVLLMDRELRVSFANAAALLGRPLTEVVGREMTEVYPYITANGFLEVLRGVLETGELFVRDDQPLVSPRGIVFKLQVHPLRDADGSVCELMVVARDVTQEHAAAQVAGERLALADQLRNVGESVPGLICSLRVDARGLMTMPFATRAVEDLLGFPRERLAVDFTLASERFHPEDRPRVLDALEASRAQLTPWHDVWRYLHPAKGQRWVEGWARPCREADGSVLWHGFVMDVTEREQLNADLRQRDEQLRVAQRMESVGRLAGGVAHDFNNLLTVIQSYTALVMEALPAGSQALDDMDQVRQAADQAAALTRQLLTFSRKQVVQPKLVDLNEVTARSVKLLGRVLGEDVKVQVTLAEQPLPTMADPGQLEQVIMNLAVNARDAMLDGGALTLRTSAVDLAEPQRGSSRPLPPGPCVCLAVTDTGCGIDPATLERIFEPFFTTKAVGKGTGLGLSTVEAIVEQCGGAVQVDSALGQGTTFTVLLPKAPTQVVAPEPRLDARDLRGRELVLVVEDEDEVRALVERLLTGYGYRVLSAKTGARGLELAQANAAQLGLLLTDVVLPDLRGREVAERMRALLPTLKVLFMSGYAEETLSHHGVLADGLALLPKPFTAEKLAAKVRDVLDGARP